MRNIYYQFFILLIFSGLLYAQEDKVLAKVGPYKIYESEFRERFDFSAHPNLMQKSDRLAAKEEFLHQLIAEKLLSLDAREKGYDTSEDFKSIFTPLENMFVRDALYTKEIKDKVTLSQQDIKEGLNRILKLINVEFIYSKQEKEIQEIFNQLVSGASFDSLLSYRSENDANPRQVTFGTMDKKIEDSVYNLKPGQFTGPIASDDGFYIIKLISIANNPDVRNTESTYENVKKIVGTRIEHQIYLDYYHNFFKDSRVTADKGIFEKLVKIFMPEFKAKYSNRNIKEGNENKDKFYLKGNEIYSALQKIDPDSRKGIFIKIKEKPVKVGPFLNQLSLDGLVVKDLNEMSIGSSLSAYIRKYIEDQLLAAEGLNKGLENSPEVKKYVGMW
ncbi:MAG TPA: peptidylprolyl isomerase, partial [Ignavibacteriaceae bacterium]|nr:peptidylprolyl isomerase [Ignavibacteriaceae bacterium]